MPGSKSSSKKKTFLANVKAKAKEGDGVASKTLATILQLERKARSAQSVESLAFRIVNETKLLLSYRQAVLWNSRTRDVMANSGVPISNENAPYLIWLKKLFRAMENRNFEGISRVSPDDFGGDIQKEWADWLPAHGVVVPLKSGGGIIGLLFFAAESKWRDSDLTLLEYLADAYGYSLDVLQRVHKGPIAQIVESCRGHRKGVLLVALVCFALMLFPVSITVLAPAEIVAAKPTLIRAAVDGIVSKIHVKPNTHVKSGDLLISLDKRNIQAEINVAEKALHVAEIELRQAAQSALVDSRDNVKVAVLRAEMEEQQARVSYYEELLQRTDLYAPHDGIAVFESESEWIGRPVQIGETIITIANEGDVRLNIELPAGDLIELQEGADVKYFLNISPATPLPATLEYISYRADVTPDGVLAYQLKARFNDSGVAGSKRARIGLRGTAKIYGDKVPLVYYILRKPLASLRQWIGF